MLRLVLLIPLLGLLGCESIPPSETSPFHRVPGGSRLILNTNLLVPPYSAKIYIQNGWIAYGANQYYPYCKLQLQEPKFTPQEVLPGVFEIYRSRRITDLFASLEPQVQHVRARLYDGKPSPIVYGTDLFLRSAEQPQVYKLMCGHMQDPNLTARHLTIEQIRATLGEVFTLQLSGPPLAQ